MMGEHTVESLLKDCASDDPNQQVAAIIELIKLHVETATPQLVSLLSSPYEDVRAGSARALGYLGQKESDVVGSALLKVLHDSNDLVREEAVEALGTLGYVPALGQIKSLLHTDSSWLVRAAAAEALGNFEDSTFLSDLEQALKDEYEPVRAYAAISIGLISSADFLPKLEKYVDAEESLGVKAELLVACYRLGASASMSRLLSILEKADEDLAMVIFNSLQDLSGWKPPATLRNDLTRIRATLVMVVQRLPRLRTHAEEIEKNLTKRERDSEHGNDQNPPRGFGRFHDQDITRDSEHGNDQNPPRGFGRFHD